MTRPSLRPVLAAATAVLGLALAGCGSSTPAAPISLPTGLPATTAPAASTPTHDPGPWTSACDAVSDAQVIAAASGYGTTITVIGHEPKEETDGGGRISTCVFALKGSKGNGSVTGPGIEVSIAEGDADIYFPPDNGQEAIPGLGDGAYWGQSSPPSIYSHIGKRLYKVSGTAPVIDAANLDQINKDVVLKVAQAVLAHAA
jgi:hypothetical protein